MLDPASGGREKGNNLLQTIMTFSDNVLQFVVIGGVTAFRAYQLPIINFCMLRRRWRFRAKATLPNIGNLNNIPSEVLKLAKVS